MSHGGGGGCPIYWLTWADMITLLLTFFVVLASLGKIEQTEKYNAVVNSMKETFGNFTPGSRLDIGDPGLSSASMMKKLQEEMTKQAKANANNKKNTKESQLGKSATVRNIRDGLLITVGGLSLFEESKADLMPDAQNDLTNVARIIKGYRNKVLIRGHTSRTSLPDGSKFKTNMELAYARANAVLEFLVKEGVARERLNIEACAGNEPVKTNVYDDEGLASNRRVEIVVKDQMVEDYEGEQVEKK
jgi:chemotaxis protein MotB